MNNKRNLNRNVVKRKKKIKKLFFIRGCFFTKILSLFSFFFRMSSTQKKKHTKKYSPQNTSTMKDSRSLEEYEEQKNEKLQKLKKQRIEDERLIKEMTRPGEREVLERSRIENVRNPLGVKGSKNYEKTRSRLLQKYIMK